MRKELLEGERVLRIIIKPKLARYNKPINMDMGY